ncbi:MAG: HK97 gp10 family phage protein [Bacilli bacterium]|nr:HK97 gp10 family phage protein [Bacilli bacterium]
MARFQMELPNDLIKEFEKLEKNTEQMMGEMTKAGAEVVMANVKKNIPSSFLDSDIMNCLKLTRVYKTPSDDGINTKIGFYGYFKNHLGVKTPAPLVVNVFEHGSSKVSKKPFFRKSFKKSQIEKAMLETQKQYIKED